MKKIILMRGLPGSGKSFWAKKMIDDNPGKYKRVNKDELRMMLDNGKWSKENEKFILEIRDLIIIEALREGKYDVIVDDTNFHPKHEERMKQVARDSSLEGKQIGIEIKDFTDVPLEECIKRDQKRTNYVGEKVIRQMYQKFLKPKPKVLWQDPKLSSAVVIDLDGTLALFGDKNPYERDFINDLVNEPVKIVLAQLRDFWDALVIICSGRDEKYRKETEEWLKNRVITYHRLYMRKTNDKRKDSIIKKEIYDEFIKDKYNVKIVLDDRDQVVDFWRSEGLTVFQVAEGDF